MTTIALRRPRATRLIAAIALVVACILSITLATRVAVALWWLTGCQWRNAGATRWHRLTRADLAHLQFHQTTKED